MLTFDSKPLDSSRLLAGRRAPSTLGWPASAKSGAANESQIAALDTSYGKSRATLSGAERNS
jgi:hypothetical protein